MMEGVTNFVHQEKYAKGLFTVNVIGESYSFADNAAADGQCT
mgnify:CR=1 FL=1